VAGGVAAEGDPVTDVGNLEIGDRHDRRRQDGLVQGAEHARRAATGLASSACTSLPRRTRVCPSSPSDRVLRRAMVWRSTWTTLPRGPLATWFVNPCEESVRGEIIRAPIRWAARPTWRKLSEQTWCIAESFRSPAQTTESPIPQPDAPRSRPKCNRLNHCFRGDASANGGLSNRGPQQSVGSAGIADYLEDTYQGRVSYAWLTRSRLQPIMQPSLEKHLASG
jgi:hypothetical protein